MAGSWDDQHNGYENLLPRHKTVRKLILRHYLCFVCLSLALDSENGDDTY